MLRHFQRSHHYKYDMFNFYVVTCTSSLSTLTMLPPIFPVVQKRVKISRLFIEKLLPEKKVGNADDAIVCTWGTPPPIHSGSSPQILDRGHRGTCPRASFNKHMAIHIRRYRGLQWFCRKLWFMSMYTKDIEDLIYIYIKIQIHTYIYNRCRPQRVLLEFMEYAVRKLFARREITFADYKPVQFVYCLGLG